VAKTGMAAPDHGLDAAVARRRVRATLLCLLACFVLVAGQVVRLALRAGGEARANMVEPLSGTVARPDIVDRRGRLLATDVPMPSLYADPALILDPDEAAEKLSAALSTDARELRRSLADRSRRFVWLARQLPPRLAQRVHELGLPGLAFRSELKRAYPLRTLAGHVIGTVNVDNRGLAGMERMLDEQGRVATVLAAAHLDQAPLRLALDVGVEHALSEELKAAARRYAATGAAGLVLDIACGGVVAAVSLPEVDPSRPADWRDSSHADRVTAGSYELGSVFKTLTVAMALESGIADLDTTYDVRRRLLAGRYTIKDVHPARRPLSVREIFLHSSNIGAGMLARQAGRERQRAFLKALGLLEPMRTEAGPLAPPQLPRSWAGTETITIGYGYGLAVAPLQFAAAVASLINGGTLVRPTWLASEAACAAGPRVVSTATSAKLRELMRLNVTHAEGTGRRAEAEGYRVGGKTGTAELLGRSGYREHAVLTSFVGAFPMDAPQYVTLVLLFDPQGGEEGRGHNLAGLNAAPLTGAIVGRIAPLLGVLPRHGGAAFAARGAFEEN
jgi:cell division protein FtsI (penicillin-binding protein 3)